MRRSDMERDCTGAFGKGKSDGESMEMKRKRTKMITLTIASIVLLALATDFLMVRKAALNRFAGYEAKAKSIDTSYGKISFIDEGEGEAFLVFHGITVG